MTIYQGVDLLKAVERYESAMHVFRQAHHDVRDVLHDQLLFERWRQLGVELGFETPSDNLSHEEAPRAGRSDGDLHEIELSVADLHDDLLELEKRDGDGSRSIPGMAEAWAD